MGHSTGRTRLDTTISCPAEFRINRLNVVNDVHQHQQLTIQSAIRTLLLRGWQALQFCTGMEWNGMGVGTFVWPCVFLQSSLRSPLLHGTGNDCRLWSGNSVDRIAKYMENMLDVFGIP